MRIRKVGTLIAAPKDGSPSAVACIDTPVILVPCDSEGGLYDAQGFEANPVASLYVGGTFCKDIKSAVFNFAEDYSSIICIDDIDDGEVHMKVTYDQETAQLFEDRILGRTFAVTLTGMEDGAEYSAAVSFVIAPNKAGQKGDKGDTGDNGEKGERGSALRGPMEWSEVEDGFMFLSGAEGEMFTDYVTYKDCYYVCGKSHAKTSSNDPATSVASNDGYWKLGSAFDMIVANILLAAYAKINSLGVKSIYIADDEGNVLISANKEGLVCNFGTFKNITVKDADVSGTLTSENGRIGGFSIGKTGLSNSIDGKYDNDAYVIFRNDTYGTFAGIGGNVLPLSSGVKGVARFENYSKGNSWLGSYVNYAMLVGAQGSFENVAINMSGGYVAGLCLRPQVISKSTTLSRGVNVVLCINSEEITLTLPTMQTYDDGYVLWVKNLNGSNVKIKPGQSYHYSTDTAYSSSETLAKSYIHYDRGSYAKCGKSEYDDLESKGDATMYVYARDLYVTVDSVKYRGCWVQFKHPRDW